MDIQPINRQALSQMVANQIQTQITEGSIVPGERLPSESALCESFQVSRPVLREALAMLVSKGILERRNNGIFAKHIDLENMLETVSLMVATNGIPFEHIWEARFVLECENAGLAAERASKEDIEEMRNCVLSMERAGSTEEEIRYYATEFHHSIAKATHNSILESFYRIVQEVLRQDPRATNILRESASFHRVIFEYIQAGDAESARKEMEKHLHAVRSTHFSDL